MNTLGIDIGGTKIYAALYDKDMKMLQEERISTQAEEGSDVVFTNIVQIISTFPIESITSIGVAWPGFVNRSGKIEKTPNISGFEGRYLANEIQELLGISCVMQNDARLFALAEHEENASAYSTLGIICGTGCGGGVVHDGVIMEGGHGYAGEIGHILVAEQEAEDLFAGQGVHDYCIQQGWEGEMPDIQKTIEKTKEDAQKKLQPLLDDFVFFLRNLVIAYDVDDIVVGGSVGKYFWGMWKEELQKSLSKDLETYPNKTTLRVSTLENAGARGAALFANSIMVKESGLI